MMKEFPETFKQHDKFQVEMKFAYPVAPDREHNRYKVDTYIFIPANLGVTPASYPKDNFYQDMNGYIRLKTPEVLLSVMTDGRDSPLQKLERSIRELIAEPSQNAVEKYSRRMKMFCSIMKSALRDGAKFLERAAEDPNLEKLTQKYLDEAETITTKFRSLKLILQVPSVDRAVLELYEHSDEFLSLSLNKYRYKLLEFSHNELRKRIFSLLESEIDYRKKNKFPSVPKQDSDNEEYVYRESTLKKAMASVLFLKTDTRRDGVLIENLFFCVAAGTAMTFATLIAYLYKAWFMEEMYLFFAVLVLAYMGKDRIKDLLKAYFHDKVSHYVYDYKTIIFSALGRRVGIRKESFRFVPENQVPADIRALRNKGSLSDLENGAFGESVILARNMVCISTKKCSEIFRDFKVDGIVDIMRFNVRRFLQKMDNPVSRILMPDGTGGIMQVNAKRVYHVNIVVRYSMPDCEDRFCRMRLILSRNGIERIEKSDISLKSKLQIRK